MLKAFLLRLAFLIVPLIALFALFYLFPSSQHAAEKGMDWFKNFEGNLGNPGVAWVLQKINDGA
ncbi:hypothetical protein K2X83_02680, partial [Patescibacteria group bacterium]|nr:hypothetical protein [Patescibacteria group bacterium]